MGDPQISPQTVKEIGRAMRALLRLNRRLQKIKRPKASVKSRRDLETLKVFIYEQKVPKDGHGFVVIIDSDRGFADAQFLNEYLRLWPKSSAADQLAHLKNAKVTVKPYAPSIVLNDHGI